MKYRPNSNLPAANNSSWNICVDRYIYFFFYKITIIIYKERKKEKSKEMNENIHGKWVGGAGAGGAGHQETGSGCKSNYWCMIPLFVGYRLDLRPIGSNRPMQRQRFNQSDGCYRLDSPWNEANWMRFKVNVNSILAAHINVWGRFWKTEENNQESLEEDHTAILTGTKAKKPPPTRQFLSCSTTKTTQKMGERMEISYEKRIWIMYIYIYVCIFVNIFVIVV